MAAANHRFGVVIPTREEHLHWVRGTCASIRHFMGTTPICVILDGERFPEELRATYDVLVVRRDEVEPKELRDLSFGSLRTKNIPLWASPFETFLVVDADTIVWGDMRRLADFERFDFVLDRRGIEPLRSVMDVEAVSRSFPGFDARRHVGDYVNNGAYFGRRGALDLDRYLHAIRLSGERPGLFYGSQGAFNYLVFRSADEGAVRVGHRELQVMTGRTERRDLVRRFAFDGQGRPKVIGDPVVLHWVGSPKPRVRGRRTDYFAPMTYFRREFRRAARADGAFGPADALRLRYEDAICSDWRGSNARGRIARARRRTRQRYAGLRVWARRRTPDWIVEFLRRPTSARAPSDDA